MAVDDAPAPTAATIAEPAAPPETHRVRGWLRWVFTRRLCFGGIAGGLVFFWLSLTPSLLPRAWLFQGAVSGVTAVIGYGTGSGLSALTRRVMPREPSRAAKRVAWRVLAGVGVLVSILLLWQTHHWQNELRRLFGIDDQPEYSGLGVVLLTAIVGGLVLVVSRMVRSFTRFCVRQTGRIAPRPVAVGAGVVVAVVVLVGIFQGFLWRGAIEIANRSASLADGRTNEGTERPTDPSRSGSPDSLVTWGSLGRQGREFVAHGPTVDELEALHGAGCCEQPIRVYVGLDAAGSAEERAALAVRELERTGAFDREVLGVFTATGTGWINPRVSAALEYIHGGDTAEVSMQYSYLPSAVSFLVDTEKAKDAGDALINAVLARVDEMPADERPKVFLYGESLGSFGTEHAFDDLADLRSKVDGALLVGPTFANPIWKQLTDDRVDGSPQWLPELPPGTGAYFAGRPDDLDGIADDPTEPKVVYLQNASDPITWWSASLAYRNPDWTGQPDPPDRSPAFRWAPVVTFWQVAGDLVDSLGVPAGHGHYFGTNVVDGWVAVSRPDGWTAEDTREVRALLSNTGE